MKPAKYHPPLTLDITREQDRAIRRNALRHGFTQSNFVRAAIKHFDPAEMPANPPRFRQISVRLDRKTRARLAKIARQKHASVGEVLRAALNQAT